VRFNIAGCLTQTLCRCIQEREVPQQWLTTVIIGILKSGKPARDPNSYRLIALESCLLKFLTLLCELRMRAWAESNGIIPPSQNGFMPKRRTINNCFILRCAVDKARSMQKNLYVVYFDLSNAFPWTDLPTLWSKLHRLGVRGPIFDWLRMLYARMTYTVRHCDHHSEVFKSLVGVLTGDTLSPLLWNIYLSDFKLHSHFDDIRLSGCIVSHTEQADDVAVFSCSVEGVQQHANSFSAWCSPNSALINVSKTWCQIFGPLPSPLPHITVYGQRIEIAEKVKYVGMNFVTTQRYIFAEHYKVKELNARKITRSIFPLEGYIGPMPPAIGRMLYMARVDPHLIYGAEVCLDINTNLLRRLEGVQLDFLRRFLRLPERSMKAILFTETGLLPIRHRRIIIALHYLLYLVEMDASLPPHLALLECIHLARLKVPSWFTDLQWVLRKLESPVVLPTAIPSRELVTRLVQEVAHSYWYSAQADILASPKTFLLPQRVKVDHRSGLKVHINNKLMTYFSVIRTPSHRLAYMRFITSNHRLAVEVLRWHRTGADSIPRPWRLCRFCQEDVEDEYHAFLFCSGSPALLDARRSVLRSIFEVDADLRELHALVPEQFLLTVLHRVDTMEIVAKYLHRLHVIFTSSPIVIPHEESYRIIVV
jgi:hypothetical protein